AKLPLFRYFFSEDSHNTEDDEILIILTPHIVRMPEWTRANMKPLYSGSESEVKVRREESVRSPNSQPPAGTQQSPANQAPANPVAGVAPAPPQTPPTLQTSLGGATTVQGGTDQAQIRFEPQSLSLKVGQPRTVGVVVGKVNDLL